MAGTLLHQCFGISVAAVLFIYGVSALVPIAMDICSFTISLHTVAVHVALLDGNFFNQGTGSCISALFLPFLLRMFTVGIICSYLHTVFHMLNKKWITSNALFCFYMPIVTCEYTALLMVTRKTVTCSYIFRHGHTSISS